MSTAMPREFGYRRGKKGCTYVSHIRLTVDFILTFIDSQFFECVLLFGLYIPLLTSLQMNTTHVFC
jgi:hypothetical protein